MDKPAEHLGDGVYAKIENETIVLMANSHITPTDKIYLEPEVLFRLIKFVEMQRNYS